MTEDKKDRETVRQKLIKASLQDRNDHLDRDFLRSQGIHVEEPNITWEVLEPKGMEGMGPALQDLKDGVDTPATRALRLFLLKEDES